LEEPASQREDVLFWKSCSRYTGLKIRMLTDKTALSGAWQSKILNLINTPDFKKVGVTQPNFLPKLPRAPQGSSQT